MLTIVVESWLVKGRRKLSVVVLVVFVVSVVGVVVACVGWLLGVSSL